MTVRLRIPPGALVASACAVALLAISSCGGGKPAGGETPRESPVAATSPGAFDTPPSTPTRTESTPSTTDSPSSSHTPTPAEATVPTSACPTGKEELTVVEHGITFELGGLLEEPIGAYLNSGGSPSGLVAALQTLCGALIADAPPQPVLAEAVAADVTGDGGEDVLVALTIPYGGDLGEGHVLAFVAQDAGFDLNVLYRRAGAGSAAEGLYAGGGPGLLEIVDMNANGMREVAFAVRWSGYTELYVGEWTGDSFESLIQVYSPIQMIDLPYITAAPATAEISDLDGDGTRELIIEERVPGDLPAFPARLRHRQVWGWDGRTISLRSNSVVSAPEYRIEALIFGDLVWRTFHDPQLAIELYQQAVFDQALSPGSPGRPEPLSNQAEDEIEAQRLAALGRLRIVMALVWLGDQRAAQTAYDSLLTRFPEGSPGHPYLLMAREFWSAYAVQGSFLEGCKSAEAYAGAHAAEILDPLGPATYGDEYVQDPAIETECYGWLYGPG